jgi:hypothetical protein
MTLILEIAAGIILAAIVLATWRRLLVVGGCVVALIAAVALIGAIYVAGEYIGWTGVFNATLVLLVLGACGHIWHKIMQNLNEDNS